MTEFKGVAPFDPETDVGKFRVLLGDTSWTELDDHEPGFGNYSEVSDAEIQVFVDGAYGNLYRALGDYHMSVAGKAAAESKLVKDFDLQVSLQTRSRDYRQAGQAWWDRAKQDDESQGLQDVFEMYPVKHVSYDRAELDTYSWNNPL